MRVGDVEQRVDGRRMDSVTGEPGAKSFQLLGAGRDLPGAMLGHPERLERADTGIRKDAEGKQRAAADPVFAVNECLVARPELLPYPGDAVVEHFLRNGATVLRRQVEELEPVPAQDHFVVAALATHVDDAGDSQLAKKLPGPFHGKTAPDRELRRDPAQVERFLHEQYLLVIAAQKSANSSIR